MWEPWYAPERTADVRAGFQPRQSLRDRPAEATSSTDLSSEALAEEEASAGRPLRPGEGLNSGSPRGRVEAPRARSESLLSPIGIWYGSLYVYKYGS